MARWSQSRPTAAGCSPGPRCASLLRRAAAAGLALLLLGGQIPVRPVLPAASLPQVVQPAPLKVTPAPGMRVLEAQVPPLRVAPLVVVLPDVVNQELQAAVAELRSKSFQVQTSALDRQGGRRRVERMAPAGGEKFIVGQLPTVTLYHRAWPGDDVSPPVARPTLMPDLTGASCDDAQRMLAAIKRSLASCLPGSFTGRLPVGRIQRQDPAPRTVLGPNSVLRAWTELGGVIVPDVRGQPVPAAQDQLRSRSLQTRIAGNEPVQPWHIVGDQTPRPRTPVAPRSTVQLTLAARWIVPALVGSTCDRAGALVRSAGLGDLTCLDEPADDAIPDGRIHRQSPAAGTVLTALQPVHAWRQPTRTVVPRVIDLPEAQALQTVRAARLTPRPEGPAARAGRLVAEQQPPEGTRVVPGSVVSLRLALTVPDLRGLDCAAATARATTFGFSQLDCVARRAPPSHALRRIFEQEPAAGSRHALPVTLRVLVAEPVRVPALRGLPLQQALRLLATQSLVGQADAQGEHLEVEAQSPPAGTEVTPDSVVRLTTVAMGIVPGVGGLSLTEASTRLTQAGFVARPDATDRPDARRVVTQTPAAGQRERLGRAVRLGTQVQLVVPDVTNLRVPQAMERLASAGLAARDDRADHAEQRVVRAQAPVAGATVTDGAAVTLTTVRRVTVPPVADMSCAGAQARLRDAGLAPGSCEVDTWLPIVLGEPRITWQSQRAGTELDEASGVALRAAPPAWSAPAVVGSALLAAGGAGMLWRRKTVRPPPPRGAPPMHWRVEPDAAPMPHLRVRTAQGDDARDDTRDETLPPEGDDAAPPRGASPTMRWHVQRRAPQACLRGLPHPNDEDEEDDDEPSR